MAFISYFYVCVRSSVGRMFAVAGLFALLSGLIFHTANEAKATPVGPGFNFFTSGGTYIGPTPVPLQPIPMIGAPLLAPPLLPPPTDFFPGVTPLPLPLPPSLPPEPFPVLGPLFDPLVLLPGEQPTQPFDTIIERLPPPGPPPLIPPPIQIIEIELVALSLQSIQPIQIGGFDYDISLQAGSLFSLPPSLGILEIFHNPFDTGGTFNLTLDLVGLLIFNPLLPDLAPIIDPFLFEGPLAASSVPWSHVAPVPVPAALPLFLSGLFGLGVMARRRRIKGGNTART